MIINKMYHDCVRQSVQKKLTTKFAETMRCMITNVPLRISINKSLKDQICILESDSVTSFKNKKRYLNTCDVKLIDAKTITAAELYKKHKVCVLNFACSVEPGGGVLVGSVAQEESLCRSTTLYPCLCSKEMFEQFYFPHIKSKNYLGTDDCIFTPGITVFQTDEFYPKFRTNEKWFQIDVITCSAPALNHTCLNGKSLYELHYKRLIRILDVAANNKAEIVILGAFGCGAFRNNPYIVSESMMNVVKCYRHMFKKIIFAIPNNKNHDINFDAFKSAINNFF